MTVIMTAKHQITIPKKIADVLGLNKGTMFNIELKKNRIELIPLELQEKIFTDAEYKKLDLLVSEQKGKEKKVTKKYIQSLK